MLNRLLPSLFVAPVTSTLPGVPILLTALAFDLLGNALRDLLDPRLAE
jgi:ABC-type dipeptide/oligopeptide/nickel transport system permease subunit